MSMLRSRHVLLDIPGLVDLCLHLGVHGIRCGYGCASCGQSPPPPATRPSLRPAQAQKWGI